MGKYEAAARDEEEAAGSVCMSSLRGSTRHLLPQLKSMLLSLLPATTGTSESVVTITRKTLWHCMMTVATRRGGCLVVTAMEVIEVGDLLTDLHDVYAQVKAAVAVVSGDCVKLKEELVFDRYQITVEERQQRGIIISSNIAAADVPCLYRGRIRSEVTDGMMMMTENGDEYRATLHPPTARDIKAEDGTDEIALGHPLHVVVTGPATTTSNTTAATAARDATVATASRDAKPVLAGTTALDVATAAATDDDRILQGDVVDPCPDIVRRSKGIHEAIAVDMTAIVTDLSDDKAHPRLPLSLVLQWPAHDALLEIAIKHNAIDQGLLLARRVVVLIRGRGRGIGAMMRTRMRMKAKWLRSQVVESCIPTKLHV